MTTYDLMIKVKDILEANGFETSSPRIANEKDFETSGTAVKKDRKELSVEFREVYRSNATDENISVDIEVIKWDNNSGIRSGIRATKQRINSKMSDRSINNRVKKIMGAYETL